MTGLLPIYIVLAILSLVLVAVIISEIVHQVKYRKIPYKLNINEFEYLTSNIDIVIRTANNKTYFMIFEEYKNQYDNAKGYLVTADNVFVNKQMIVSTEKMTWGKLKYGNMELTYAKDGTGMSLKLEETRKNRILTLASYEVYDGIAYKS